MGLKDFPVDGLSNSSDNILLLQGVHKDLEKGGLQEVQDMAKKLG
jgi:hypothetical protein